MRFPTSDRYIVAKPLQNSSRYWHMNCCLVDIMVRRARIKPPEQIYSVVTRVNDRLFAFEHDAVCETFLNHLKYVKKKLKFTLYGFIIMPSHVHLCIKPNESIADISVIMKHINGGFAQKYNKHFKKRGHFWLERFQSVIVEGVRYTANTITYFAYNPIDAGIVENPLDFKFSSIHNLFDSNKFADILDPLPYRLAEGIKEFVKSHKYSRKGDKYKRIKRKYSFNISKSKADQLYRNFIGSKSFVLKYNEIYIT